MKSKVGLWVDSKKAVIVFVKDKEVEKTVIESKIDTQLGRYDGVKSVEKYDSKLVPADDIKERYLKGHFNIYFDEIISVIKDSERILIFGPGEIKTMLIKRMAKSKLDKLVEGVETTDKLTDPQVIAKVQKHFIKQPLKH